MAITQQQSEHRPLVSVIVPAYNAADYTVETIKSILSQTYQPVEILVVDDGSSDDTLEKISVFGDKIKVISKENGGASSARNAGIKAARGELIAVIDCDDLYCPAKIERSVEYLLAHPDVGMVHTNLHFINADGKILKTGRLFQSGYHGWIKEKLIVTNLISNTTVLIRRECFDKVGLFNEALFPPADWEMWLRISEKYKIGYIHEPLSMYRVASNWNYKNLQRVIDEEKIVLDEFFERNPDVSKRVKDKAYSRYHFTVAKNYVAQGEYDDMKRHLMLSLAFNPLNMKADIMFLLFLLSKEMLKKKAAQSLFVGS